MYIYGELGIHYSFLRVDLELNTFSSIVLLHGEMKKKA